jgi:hypothetical protein
MPRRGSPSYPGVRTWPLKQFPYTLVYRVKGEVISVLAVAHQSREPGVLGGSVDDACTAHYPTFRSSFTLAGRSASSTLTT